MKSIIELILDAIFDADLKGKAGEKFTSNKLEWINFLGFKGKVLRNIYIPKDNGETSEIDLVYITKKGIFVIESKNYSGYVFGSEDNQYWTITLNAGHGKTVKNKLYNPIKQNKTHIKWLKEFLNEDIQTISAIVFSDRCKLKKTEIERRNDLFVINRKDLTFAIGKRFLLLKDCLTEEKIDDIYSKLEKLTNVNQETKQKHIEDINANLTKKCPKCGGELVLRTASKGPNAGSKFYGCSNYPKCKYTKNIQ